MDTALATKTMRRESWAAMLRDQASSGLTIHEWCDQNQNSTKAYHAGDKTALEIIAFIRSDHKSKK